MLLSIWDAVEMVEVSVMGTPIRGATGADSKSLQTNRQASLRLIERCADILISIRGEIVDAGPTVAEELCTPIAKIVGCVPSALIRTHVFYLIRIPHRAFGEILYCLNKLGRLPFLNRYLMRNKILSDISACDTALKDARETFGVSVVFYSAGHFSRPTLTRSSALTGFYPDPHTEDCQSYRAATKGNTRSA